MWFMSVSRVLDEYGAGAIGIEADGQAHDVRGFEVRRSCEKRAELSAKSSRGASLRKRKQQSFRRIGGRAAGVAAFRKRRITAGSSPKIRRKFSSSGPLAISRSEK